MYSDNYLVHRIRQDVSNIEMSISLAWSPAHVGVRGYENLDDITTIEIPYGDLMARVRSYYGEKWQNLWINGPSIMKELKSTTKRWKSTRATKRRDQVVISRLRMHHIRWSHQGVFKGNEDLMLCECG